MILNGIVPLVFWEYGIWLIGIFAVVCIALVAVVLSLMKNDKKKQ